MIEENDIGISIVCYSLIDITNTGITNSFTKAAIPLMDKGGQKVTDQESWLRSRNQQRNFETLIQGISLRSQPLYSSPPKLEGLDTAIFNFGEEYTGVQFVWTFKFKIEHPQAFKKNDDELGLLLDDLNYVPCILNLTETAEIKDPIFITLGPKTNIQFDILQ